VLFVHGDDDRNVPFQQTTDLVEKTAHPRCRVRASKGSALMAILGHWSFDFTFVILNLLFTAAIVTDYGSTLPVLIGLGVVALSVIALTRGRLGYQHYRQEKS
jgi:hypothetical protein